MSHRVHQATVWLALACCLGWLLPGQQAARPQRTIIIKATTSVVLVNLTVTNHDGQPVRNLKPGDITLYEDGKAQSILSLDWENLSAPAQVSAAEAANGPDSAVINGTPAPKAAAPAAGVHGTVAAEAYPDRRLVVLYFDLTTMQPEDVQSVVEQADSFINQKMQPADLVAVASLGNTLQVNQDFTADKKVLLAKLADLNPATSSGFEDGGDGTTDGTPDDGNSFTQDDTEFNIANADRSLEAIQTLSEMLAGIQQKKSVLFFSDGISRSGIDNEITLRSAVNAAVKANVALYSVDARGLQVRVPGGSANTASTRGQGAYTSGGILGQLNSQFGSQETVATLANDTGGEAFLDSNDFAPAYAKVQADTNSYYLISYSSSNPAHDGKYRKIRIEIKGQPGDKLSFRPGYYADRDISHMNSSDRQQQLMDQLTADVPDESLPMYANDGFLRLNRGRYFIPVAIAIPGSAIPMHGAKANATPTVDVDGMVRDRALRQIGHIQQTIKLDEKLTGNNPNQLEAKNLQYDTGFVVTPGVYEIRLAARENQVGQMGAFGTIISIPDLAAEEVKAPTALAMSSILVGSQLQKVRPELGDPLTANGEALVESVTHVFDTGQHFYVYYEIYDPKANAQGDINVATNVAFYRGKVRVFQTPLQTIRRETDPLRRAVVVQLDIPLAKLAPGYYTCQVNAMDYAAGRFAFPRVLMLVRTAVPTGR